MIKKIDIFQKALHHKKAAQLEGVTPETDGFYVTKELFHDINDKLSEVIDHVNALEGNNFTEELGDKRKETERLVRLVGSTKRTEAEREILEQFVNPGESCLTISATNVLSGSEDIYGFDVVLVKRMDGETDNYAEVSDKAIELANNRAIMGIHISLMEQWNMYMARVPFHWEQYEFQGNPEEIEYFIIDKLEGQKTLAGVI